MVEAVMLWNEPNNLSHWNFEIDPDWSIFARMVNTGGRCDEGGETQLRRVLGGSRRSIRVSCGI